MTTRATKEGTLRLALVLPLAWALVAGCAPGGSGPRGLVDARVGPRIEAALEALPAARVTSLGPASVPRFVAGDLGRAPAPAAWTDAAADLAPALARVAPVFGVRPTDLELVRAWRDDLGAGHARYREVAGGLPVVGGDLVVHVDARGRVYAVGGTAAPLPGETTPTLSAGDARAAVGAWAGRAAGTPRLVYEVGADTGVVRLAWEVPVGPEAHPTPASLVVYLDAATGGWLDVRPQVMDALDRTVYDVSTGSQVLARSEGQGATGKPDVDAAYDNTGTTWTFYDTTFGRDSVDNQGLGLVSLVHDQSAYQNAFWDPAGEEMHFGDGDGTTFLDLALALDVTAHELTHGVDQFTANLTYQDESGALNEAFSDIMGASCEAWRDGGVNANTWKIGEEIYTPGTPGDALRYMNDPTADGISYDYYPERYQGTQDYGGVHENSGIANLAYYLTVAGGTHPRSKTTVTVPGIGIAKAQAIYYRSLSTYLTAGSQFQDCRAATVQAALDLYDQATADAVNLAWDAVGVPNGSQGSTAVELTNKAPVTGLAAATGADLLFYVNVTAGATNFTIQLSGGTGDADLYVRYGSPPTLSTYDYRPYLPGNDESVTVSPITTGRWYVMVHGYQTFSGAQLVAAYDPRLLTPPPRPSLPPPAPTP